MPGYERYCIPLSDLGIDDPKRAKDGRTARQRIQDNEVMIISGDGGFMQAGIVLSLPRARLLFNNPETLNDKDHCKCITHFLENFSALLKKEAITWYTIDKGKDTVKETQLFVYCNPAFIKDHWLKLQLCLPRQQVMAIAEVFDLPVMPAVQISKAQYNLLEVDGKQARPFVTSESFYKHQKLVGKEVTQYGRPVVVRDDSVIAERALLVPLCEVKTLERLNTQRVGAKAMAGVLRKIEADTVYIVTDHGKDAFIVLHPDPSPEISAAFQLTDIEEVAPCFNLSSSQGPGIINTPIIVRAKRSLKTVEVITETVRRAMLEKTIVLQPVEPTNRSNDFTITAIGNLTVLNALAKLHFPDVSVFPASPNKPFLSHFFSMVSFASELRSLRNGEQSTQEKELLKVLKNFFENLEGERRRSNYTEEVVCQNGIGDVAPLKGRVGLTLNPDITAAALSLQEQLRI